VDLAHARFGEVLDLADLAHRELFPVLQVDDAILLLGQLLLHQSQQLVARQLVLGRFAVRVGDDLERRGSGAVARIAAVGRRGRARQRRAEHHAVFVERHLERRRDVLVAGLGLLVRAQPLELALVSLEAMAPRARQPILLAQLVEQRALDAQLAVGFEAHAARGIEARDRRHQPEVRGRLQIAAVDLARQAARHAAHHVVHETLVGLHQAIAQRVARPRAPARPELLELGSALPGPLALAAPGSRAVDRGQRARRRDTRRDGAP
jgi:hypothetical protein